MTDWRPIESAPRSGVSILVCLAGTNANCVWKAYWAQRKRGARWEAWGCQVPFNPTHWMPIPEPPSAPNGDGPPREIKKVL